MIKQLTGAALGLMFAGSACAEAIYTQNFEGGLRSNESSFSAWFDEGDNRWEDNNGRWNVHDESTNPALDDGGLSGNVMGHKYANYKPIERSYYEITLDFAGWVTGAKSKTLMFDFDSWIESIGGDDGFNVVAYNGSPVTTGQPTLGSSNKDSNEMPGNLPSNWALLNPITSLTGWDVALTGVDTSDMLYDATLSYSQLDEVSGTLEGTTGHAPSDMTGTALFDLSGYTGLTTLRFSFGSGSSSSQQEGINIDNIKIAGLCTGTTSGSSSSSTGVGCQPPSTGAPEPASLALVALGLAALRRRGLRIRT